jgi:hypothetical protein
MKKSEVERFISVVKTQDMGYNAPLKEEWARAGLSIMRALAKLLGYATKDREVKFNRGGIAVSGEVWLFADDLFVQFSQSAPDLGILYRRGCVRNGRRDSCGGDNRWLKWEALLDLPNAAKSIGQCRA